MQNFGAFRALLAAADLSAATNKAMALTNAGINVAGAGVAAVGLLTDDPEAGQYGSVQVREQGSWIAGAAFNAGVLLTPDAQGRAVAAAAGDYVLAVALEASGGAGQVVSVEIVHAGEVPA